MFVLLDYLILKSLSTTSMCNKAIQNNKHYILTDVADTKSVEGIGQLVKPHIEAEGLNLLINNAGINIRHGIDTANRDNMLTSFEINVVGPLNTVQVNIDNTMKFK